MNRDKSQDDRNDTIKPPSRAPHHVATSGFGGDDTLLSQYEHVGLSSTDFPCGVQFKDSLEPPLQLGPVVEDLVWSEQPLLEEFASSTSQEQRYPATAVESDSGHGSSIHTASPADLNKTSEGSGLIAGPETEFKAGSGATRMPHKRTRSGSSIVSTVSHCSITPTYDLLSSANTALLGDNLLRIYHESFETHLSCWLTEKTCPYSKDSDVSLPDNYGPDWIRIYHRVFKLDQSISVRGRLLGISEDRAASRALNLAIISFASQWAVPDIERTAKFPFHITKGDHSNRCSQQTDFTEPLYDRSFQFAAWHQARKAIHQAAEIESFRVVLAHLVFSLIQRPGGESENARHETGSVQINPPGLMETEADVDSCEDILSRLDLTLSDDGPPLYLEQGLRLIHSLRSRMTMVGEFGGRIKKRPRCWKHLRSRGLEAADRATIDVLFWLGIMFDTLSSAINKRPLVVCLEDSDLPASKSIDRESMSISEPQTPSDPRAEVFWDDILFKRQRSQKYETVVRWPCSEGEAASLLCEAAPVKVLLFRKVTRLQALLARNSRGEKIETAVHSALEVYEHWQSMYAPFLGDCINHHCELPEQVQSWHVCLAAHWHLATLLLADLIEAIDDSREGFELRRREQESLNFIPQIRERNCRSLSDLARCACAQENNLLSRTKKNVHSTSQRALLSEPWLDVLVRAFATAGAVLLEPTSIGNGNDLVRDNSLERVEDCVRALRILGQRSDKALIAANLVSGGLKALREGQRTPAPAMVSGAVASTG